MIGKDTLFGNLVTGIKEHSRAFGIAGSVIGAILVIYYCGSIRHYPSGLSIADTLFFLWAVIVFGFYYSIVAFSFFAASNFWVVVLAKPINFILKIRKRKQDIIVPLPKNDWLAVFGVGLLANIAIGLITYLKKHSLLYIFGTIFIIGFLYVLVENVGKDSSCDTKLVDSKGNKIETNPINPELVKYIFYFLIYSAPLLFARVGGGVTNSTFETMGIRQMGVDVLLDAGGYRAALENYKAKGLLSSYSCGDVCLLEDVDILFTSIGSNTKIQMSGPNGITEVVIPSKSVHLIARKKPNKHN